MVSWVDNIVFQLVKSLSDDSVAQEAADSFHVILHDYNDVLNEAMHANIRIMYKQRFFIQTVSQLIQGFSAAAQGNIFGHNVHFHGHFTL